MRFGSQLTPEQIEWRRQGIGASDAAKILAGGEEWATLWAIKTGRIVQPRIMSDWDAALRHTTEALQCDWYEHLTERKGNVQLRGHQMTYSEWPVLRCTLDGATSSDTVSDITTIDTIFECKHLSEWTKDPINWAVEKYKGQLNHQMIVTGTDEAILSVIVGMKQPELVKLSLDPFFAEVYLARCKEFWGYVERDEPPPGATKLLEPPKSIPIEEMRVIDFTGNNKFSDFAADWLENKLAAKKFESAAKGIKEMIEPDVREASGHGLTVKRTKTGLTIKEQK